ncbi:hypothetical protein MKK88_19710 [Methylobacterium sp. E-005]|uniref:hypothetical protein n=1 Tax=Methylobacterium sp. E-005 TaxID=2836549 RepID=UPI001FBB9606|nr:hypothetical protein [Methylobacterium sp. E-005]MCJ2088191.1 hypothetical protein [Methylobacterium sp. E-005]
MASGYVIAALLEAAGVISLVFALIKIRAERRAKAAELRSFLRSGQSGAATLNVGGAQRRAVSGSRVVTVPYAAGRGRAGPLHDSAARSALRRAIARGGQHVHPGRVLPISAG